MDPIVWYQLADGEYRPAIRVRSEDVTIPAVPQVGDQPAQPERTENQSTLVVFLDAWDAEHPDAPTEIRQLPGQPLAAIRGVTEGDSRGQLTTSPPSTPPADERLGQLTPANQAVDQKAIDEGAALQAGRTQDSSLAGSQVGTLGANPPNAADSVPPSPPAATTPPLGDTTTATGGSAATSEELADARALVARLEAEQASENDPANGTETVPGI